MSEELLFFNGINGATGQYELSPMRPEDIAAAALGEKVDKRTYQTLESRHFGMEPHLSVNADTRDLSQTGWGVIFSAKEQRTETIQEALKPLLDLRREQATEKNPLFYQAFVGPDGYQTGDSHLDWLARPPRGVGPGPADPEQGVPYYLLIVGDPASIPYLFQYQLDVQYAVGRIYFDTLQEYAQYAQSVVEAEKGEGLQLARRAVLFGVKNEHDRATNLSAEELVKPLANEVSSKQPMWDVRTHLAAEAKKAQLGKLLGGEETPTFLFTASHGMGFPNGDPRQLPHQGALLCQDWPGPREWGSNPIPEDFYFSADDVGADARLLGMMAFFFACYGAGTPQIDAFARKAWDERKQIAPYPFLARLPQRILGHPKGGALAVVGHVERAWGYSFMWRDAGRQLTVFKDTLDQLLAGYPIGSAIEWFNERHAELSVALTSEVEQINEYGRIRDDAKLAGMWTANNDARNYVILGDPAARLRVVEEGASPAERPSVILEPERVDRLEELESAVVEEPPPAQPVSEPVPSPDYAVEFGLKDQFDELRASLRQFTDQLATSLRNAAREVTTLEVETYTTPDLQALAEAGTEGGDKRLRALTHISFDGDARVYVPERTGEVDRELWQLHLDMVREAQANRAQFLQTMAELATNLLKSLRP